MSKIFIKALFFFQIITIIFNEQVFQILSETGEKGTSLTSFNKNLYLISSSKIFNIINKNYNSIQNNKNAQNQGQLSSNIEIVESSINKVTKESIILISESIESTKKITLYSFNISAPLDSNNPKIIYSIDSQIYNKKISLIKIATDQYLLSYLMSGENFENVAFKYTSYEGFEITKKFSTLLNSGESYNFINCFLLYEQFPICYYSYRGIFSGSGSSSMKYFHKINNPQQP